MSCVLYTPGEMGYRVFSDGSYDKIAYTDDPEVCVSEGGISEAQRAKNKQKQNRQEGDQNTVSKSTDHRTATSASCVTEHSRGRTGEEVWHDTRQNQHHMHLA